MEKSYTYEQLIEKIVRAKIELEKSGRKSHAAWCHAEDLTGHPAPCNCGADAHNSSYNKAIDELRL
jgi:hypothetical protein